MAFQPAMKERPQQPPPEEDSSDEVSDAPEWQSYFPKQPDLGWFLDHYRIDNGARVSLCRAYASYLASQNPRRKRRKVPAASSALEAEIQ